MNNYKKHAIKEFRAAGWTDDEGRFNCEMQEAICNHVVALLDVLANEGHSGSSASYAIDLFNKLANFEPVVPLTGEEWEWTEVADGVFQNNRCSHVFKDVSRFDGKPYDINAVVFWGWYVDPETGEKSKTYFTSRDSSRVIEFPYTPKQVYQESST